MIDATGTTTLLARALVHSLWGGAVVGTVAWLLLRAVRRSAAGAELECRIAGAGAMLVALLPWLTLAATSLLWAVGEPELPAGAAATAPGVQPAAVLRLMQQALTFDVARTVLVVWATGALLVVVRIAGGAWWLRRRLLRESRVVRSAGVAELASRAGLRRVPIVREWPAARSPFVTGWRTPVLVLPPGLECLLGPDEWASLLLHEFAHVARRDLVHNALLRLLGAIAWYQAPFWWLLRELDRARERSCDDRAVATMGIGLPLARALVLLEERRGGALGLAMAGTGGDFGARVRRILSGGAGRAGSASRGGASQLALLLLATGSTLLLAGRAEGEVRHWISGVHAIIQASDPAGPFTVELQGDRLVAATIGGATIPPNRIVQQGARVSLLDEAGLPQLTLRVEAPGGISWTPRSPRRP
ncbi:MAG: M56 family metallopeptidase [Gemmatimonadales bacterium]